MEDERRRDAGSHVTITIPVIQRFIEHFTYAGLFLVLLGAGLGLPVPEEVPVVAGGALAQAGVVRWWIALPVCVLGVLCGDVVLYTVGHHWGERILEWTVVRRVLSPEREARLKAAYHRHGVKIIFLARHLMGVRAAAFLTAGIVRLGFVRFLVVDTLAALVSVPLGFGLAVLFTDQLARALAEVHRIERWLALYALLALAVWLALVAWRQGRKP
jgi:membrane protein DedA with SNARE-associated domain